MLQLCVLSGVAQAVCAICRCILWNSTVFSGVTRFLKQLCALWNSLGLRYSREWTCLFPIMHCAVPENAFDYSSHYPALLQGTHAAGAIHYASFITSRLGITSLFGPYDTAGKSRSACSAILTEILTCIIVGAPV